MFDFHLGKIPMLVSFPHSSNWIPDLVAHRMTDAGRAAPDTDWFLPRLYNFEPVSSASKIRANFSRYVIDPNRPIDGTNLYPGKPTPELCPTHCFDGSPIYREGAVPDPEEVAERICHYWEPYHDQIEQELFRLRDHFGMAVLIDAHSIRSRVPRLFGGKLPDISIGTAGGNSCSEELSRVLERQLSEIDSFTHAFDGRFIGGHITRRFGRPLENIHAVQLELSQATYMDEETGCWNDEKAMQVQQALRLITEAIAEWTSVPV